MCGETLSALFLAPHASERPRSHRSMMTCTDTSLYMYMYIYICVCNMHRCMYIGTTCIYIYIYAYTYHPWQSEDGNLAGHDLNDTPASAVCLAADVQVNAHTQRAQST